MLDLVLKNATVFVGDSFCQVDVGVKDGKIAVISQADCMPEAKEVLDEAIEAFIAIHKQMMESPESVMACPVTTPVRRLDEVSAARHPILKYTAE